jgi:hypothetical protein
MATLKNTTVNDTGFLTLPAGTTAQRPGSVANGMIRYNTSTAAVEAYANGAWGTISAGALGSQSNPASSPTAIYTANPSAANGWYYYTTGSTTYGAFTRFNWQLSRHWMLVLKVLNRGDMPSGSAFWTNTALNNENDQDISGGSWAKYAGWNNFQWSYVLMDMNGTIPAIMQFNNPRTMYDAMQNNAAAGFGGLGCNSTTPTITTNLRYDQAGFYQSGGPFGAQTGNEPIIQLYGINSFGNNSTNGNPDNAGLSSVARAGARVGCALDEGGHVFNNGNNGGSDSGFGFGFCAGNEGRTGSCGYAEWASSAVVNTVPGRLWVS